MKKLLAVFFALALVGSLGAQTATVNPAMLDFTNAKVSIAGPDSVYIRSIMYGGAELSVLLKYDGANGATVYGPYFPSPALGLEKFDLGYVRLEKFGDSILAVYDVVLGNAAYSGRLKWDGGVKLVLDSPPWQTSVPETRVAAAGDDAAKAQEYKAWGAQLAAELDSTKALLQEQTARAYAAQNAADKANADLAAAQRAAGLPVTATVSTGAAAAWTTVFDPAAGAQLKPVTFGTWKATASALTQSNSSLLFAKYAVPFTQTASNSLYGFTAKAGPTGWVGFGLHFFASGAKRADTYGFGKSYLVWLTRDEAYYRTKKAYVQLYQSSDDVTMVQIASANIGLDLTQPVNTEVVYDKTSRSLEVSVNGSVVISQLVDTIASGDAMAARTLGGGVEFSAFYVKTR